MKERKRSNAKDKTCRLFNRYVWLMDVIYRNGRISREEIDACWRRSSLNDEEEEKIPRRTFMNHKAAIEEMFGLIIDCDRRDGNRYYIGNSDDIEKGGIRKWLLNTFAVNRLINESQALKDRILFEDIPSGQRYLTPVIEAMRDGLILEMTYQSFWSDEPATFDIEPYCVKVFRQRWYVVAKSARYDAVRIFSLDRIHNLRITEKPFKMPKDFHPEAYFDHTFGITVDEKTKPCTVKIKAFGSRRKFLQTLPLHCSQQEEQATVHDAVFSYYLSPNYDFRQELLSYGDEIEVLSPDWFRNELAEKVRNMNTRYSKQD